MLTPEVASTPTAAPVGRVLGVPSSSGSCTPRRPPWTLRTASHLAGHHRSHGGAGHLLHRPVRRPGRRRPKTSAPAASSTSSSAPPEPARPTPPHCAPREAPTSGSVIGLVLRRAAEVLGTRWGSGENTTKWLVEHDAEPDRHQRLARANAALELRPEAARRSPPTSATHLTSTGGRSTPASCRHRRRSRGDGGPDRISVRRRSRAKVLLVGTGPLSAIDAGGAFGLSSATAAPPSPSRRRPPLQSRGSARLSPPSGRRPRSAALLRPPRQDL